MSWLRVKIYRKSDKVTFVLQKDHSDGSREEGLERKGDSGL